MVREEHSPVVDPIVGNHTTHPKFGVGVRFRETERCGETGTEVRAENVHVATVDARWCECISKPGEGEAGVVDGCGPPK